MAEEKKVAVDWLAKRMKLKPKEIEALAERWGLIVRYDNHGKRVKFEKFIKRAVADPDVMVPRVLTYCRRCKYRTNMSSGEEAAIGCFRAAIAHETNLTADGGDRRGTDPEKCLKFEEGEMKRSSENKLGSWW